MSVCRLVDCRGEEEERFGRLEFIMTLPMTMLLDTQDSRRYLGLGLDPLKWFIDAVASVGLHKSVCLSPSQIYS